MLDDELQEKLKERIIKANELIEKHQTLSLEIKEYYEMLKLKYDEEGKKIDGNDRNNWTKSTILNNFLDKIVNRNSEK